ncbi:MAG: NUDIX hydrolase [Burkholderiaceae bacterium]
MKFCSSCGHAIKKLMPADDNRTRSVCTECQTIHYENPRLILGTLSTWQDQILLCRRAIAPRSGYWTLPAGFMEIGESTEAGAKRETLEEAGAEVEIHDLFAVFDIPHVEQVHLFFRAAMISPHLAPGVESLEARLFQARDIPWDDLAFESVRQALRLHLEDVSLGTHRLHRLQLPKMDW